MVSLCLVATVSPYVSLLANTVQLASKLTLKCEHSHEPRRIFKSACKLLVCTKLLHECEILMSVCLRSCVAHVYFSTLSNANACHGIATCASMYEFVFIVLIPLLGC